MRMVTRFSLHSLLILMILMLTAMAASAVSVLPGYDPRNMTRSNITPTTLVDREFDLEELQDRRGLARRGDIHAAYEVGVMEQIRGNHRQAAMWYRRAALFGHPLAAHNLGVMYYNGLGVRPDETLAAKWVGKAAESGLSTAQFLYGMMHLLGAGVVEDKTLERQWLERAAMQNHALAQFHLGLIHIDGHGVPTDPVLGIALMEIAQEVGLQVEGLDAVQYTEYERQRLSEDQLARVPLVKQRLYEAGYGLDSTRLIAEESDLPKAWDDVRGKGGHH